MSAQQTEAAPDPSLGHSRRPRVPWPKARYDDESWRQDAACREIDSDLFFPVGTTGAALLEIAGAKAVCATCPVESSCLYFALATNQEFGVWGGCDPEERRVLRRQWRARAAQG